MLADMISKWKKVKQLSKIDLIIDSSVHTFTTWGPLNAIFEKVNAKEGKQVHQ